MSSPKDPISVVTAGAYPIAGVAVARLSLWRPEALVLLAALTLLGVGTAMHHWTGLGDRFGRDWDHAGMVATYAALATAAVGGAFWMFAAAVLAVFLMEVQWDVRYEAMIGACVWIAIVAGFVSGIPWFTGFGATCMGVGMILQPGRDLEHGGWHLLTALGTAALYLSIP